MLLVVDVGNTTTRVGLWRQGEVTLYTTAPAGDSVHLPEQVQEEILRLAGAGTATRQDVQLEVALSSVVPSAEEIWRHWAAAHGHPIFIVRGDTPSPLVNRYRNPSQVGGDRIAAAVGAVGRLGAPVIVASLGTATFVDAVSSESEFLGGAICVGVQTGLAALAERTAGLPKVRADAPQSLIGSDTEDCLRAGAGYGVAALVEGLARRMRQELGKQAPLALTGGHADLISPLLNIEHQVLPALTLEGIAAIWEHNRRRTE
jgi:type III pantothenate kinase